MNAIKKISALLLAALLTVSLLPAVAFAEEQQPIVSCRISTTNAKVGDDIEIAIMTSEMTVISVAGGVRYDNTKVVYKSASVTTSELHEKDGERTLPLIIDHLPEKRAVGFYGIGNEGENVTYQANSCVVVFTFTVIAPGAIVFTLGEGTDTGVIYTNIHIPGPTVTVPSLSGIEINSMLESAEYHVGDVFQTEGMVVTAVYDDGSQQETDNITADDSPLEAGTTEVEISYTEGTITKTASVPVTVSAHAYDGETHCCTALKHDGTVCGVADPQPAKPVISEIKLRTTGLTVKWNETYGATSYSVYRKAQGESSWTLLTNECTDTYYKDNTAEYGRLYGYRIKAYNGETEMSGQASDLKRGIRLAKTVVSTKSTGAGIRVSWEAVEGATSYALYRKTSGGEWTLLTTTTALSVNNTSVEYGTKYYYKVRAYNSKAKMYGETSEAAAGIKLSKVTVSTSAKTDGIYVSWTSSKGAGSYKVYRKAAGGSWKLVADNVKSRHYMDTEAKKGVVYTYAVKACNSACNSVSKASKYVNGTW